MIIHLHTLGISFMLLALVHIGFPRYFRWKEDLIGVSLVNRQMMYVHAAFIAVVVFGMGILCLTSAHELSATALGRRLCVLLSVFWLLRLATQFFGYSAQLWRGKRFETTVHVLFSMFWTYAAVVFGLVAIG